MYNTVFVILAFIIAISILQKKFKLIENYPWHYRPIHYMPTGITRYYRMDYVPPIILPPRYGDLGIYDFNYKSRFPIANSSMFCQRNPLCYPCPGWKDVGPPYCL